MAEYSSFFNSELGDRVYTASDFANYFASFIGNGVMFGGNFLSVSRTFGMNIQVLPGKAFVNGYYYENRDFPKVLTLRPADSLLPRVDRVVLRLDLRQEERKITAAVKTGIAAANPTAPMLQRDNEIWELGIADIRTNAGDFEIFASNIVDLRLSPELCGIVTGIIEQPDFSEAFARYLALYDEITGRMNSNFDDFMLSRTDDLARFTADWSKFEMAYSGWFNQIKAELFTQGNTNFDDWSRRSGYDMITTFLDDGSIDARIVNRFNSSVLAIKTTVFNTDGSISETLEFNEPKIFITKTTIFSGNIITESYV
ncbi:MAG: hypothetical protein FWE29_04875 [Defluviitaleaceae bacterium]|nr:hypothetical protein [Defluviitaleaceae bacterium]